MQIAFRIDILPDMDIQKVSKYILKKFKANTFIVTFEKAEKTNKEHLHFYIDSEIVLNVKLETFKKKFNKKLRNKYPDLKPHNSSLQVVEDYEKYIIYILKDDNIVMSNFDEDELERLAELSKEITIEKKVPQYKKVYQKLKDKNITNSHNFIIEITKLYVEDFDCPPPPRHIILQSMQYYLYMKNNHLEMCQVLNIPDVQFLPPPLPKLVRSDYIEDDKESFQTIDYDNLKKQF